jgi:hypothetical protein
MVPLASLWLPIVLAAVAVFFISAIVHMVLPIHKKDFAGLPNEDEVMEAMRRANVSRGDYMFPHAGGMEAMKDPAFMAKFARGPIGILTLVPGRPDTGMGKALALWFVYCLVVSLFAAYIASRALSAGAEDMQVARFTGAVSFIGYTLALWQSSIWYNRPVLVNIKNTFDGLLYAIATAVVFCVLWPS